MGGRQTKYLIVLEMHISAVHLNMFYHNRRRCFQWEREINTLKSDNILRNKKTQSTNILNLGVRTLES